MTKGSETRISLRGLDPVTTGETSPPLTSRAPPDTWDDTNLTESPSGTETSHSYRWTSSLTSEYPKIEKKTTKSLFWKRFPDETNLHLLLPYFSPGQTGGRLKGCTP